MITPAGYTWLSPNEVDERVLECLRRTRNGRRLIDLMHGMDCERRAWRWPRLFDAVLMAWSDALEDAAEDAR